MENQDVYIYVEEEMTNEDEDIVHQTNQKLLHNRCRSQNVRVGLLSAYVVNPHKQGSIPLTWI